MFLSQQSSVYACKVENNRGTSLATGAGLIAETISDLKLKSPQEWINFY
jgi:hypothetical protein